jgi:cytidylate kinase
MMMRKRSIEQIVDEQVKKWGYATKGRADRKPAISLVTVSREPGSGGKLIAQGIAERLNFDLFHQEVIHEMAQSAKVSTRVVESLDEKGLSMLEDWISAVVHRRHLWPDEYLQHLLKVVSTIGEHGRAVLVGRGANFILPSEETVRLRFIAPQAFRAQKVADDFDISIKAAEIRILKTESERQAFIRKYFHADIAAPLNYDLVLNTSAFSLEECIAGVCSMIGRNRD